MNRIIQVFRTGTHTDSAGTERNFSADDLRAIADNFDPEIGAVPLVKGHPATDDPAFGWVSRFMFEETSGILYAVPENVEPGFKAEVNARRYARISIALYSPDSKSNPVPGSYYPRHVGFLGAAAPAVKGLKAANFNQDEDFLMFDGNDDKQMKKFGDVIAAAFAKVFKPGEGTIEHPPKTETIKVEETPEFIESEKARKKAEDDLAAANASAAEAKDNARRAGNVAFCEGLKKAGKLTPVEAERLSEILFTLGSSDTELEFGEGDDAVKITPLKALSDFLTGLPVRVEFNEISGDNDADSLTTIGFNAPSGTRVEADRLELHQRIRAYSEKHGVAYIDAVSAIERGDI